MTENANPSNRKGHTPSKDGTRRGPLTEDEILGRLLAGRAEPSVVERDKLFEGVLADVQPSATSYIRKAQKLAWVALPLAAAAGAVLWVSIPKNSHDDYRSKGEAVTTPLANIKPVCFHSMPKGAALGPTDLVPCSSETQLAFEVQATPEAPYVAVFATRSDGQAVWFFPESSALTPRADSTPSLLPNEFSLADFAPGKYRVTVAYFEEAVGRTEIVRQLEEGNGPAPRQEEVDWFIHR